MSSKPAAAAAAAFAVSGYEATRATRKRQLNGDLPPDKKKKTEEDAIAALPNVLRIMPDGVRARVEEIITECGTYLEPEQPNIPRTRATQ
jgi:hypothetical protein